MRVSSTNNTKRENHKATERKIRFCPISPIELKKNPTILNLKEAKRLNV